MKLTPLSDVWAAARTGARTRFSGGAVASGGAVRSGGPVTSNSVSARGVARRRVQRAAEASS